MQFFKKHTCHGCSGYTADTVVTKSGIKTWEWCRREEKDGIRFLNLEFLHECPEKTWIEIMEPGGERS